MCSSAYYDCESQGFSKFGAPRAFDGQPSPSDTSALNGELTALQPRETLYAAGERKTAFYRVEAGALLIATPAPDGSLGKLRLVFPGEYIGLGFLSEHRVTARAIVASTVSSLPLDKLDEAAACCPALEQQLNDAVQFEFEQLRNKAVALGNDALPVERVANYLVVVSHIALLEGRRADLTSDNITADQLAGPLNLEPSAIKTALNQLVSYGLITWDAEAKVTIVDLARLVTFSANRAPVSLAC